MHTLSAYSPHALTLEGQKGCLESTWHPVVFLFYLDRAAAKVGCLAPEKMSMSECWQLSCQESRSVGV